MNDNYAQRFGIGFIIAMIFVLIMFQWTFPVKDVGLPKIIDDIDDVEHVVLMPTPTIIEKKDKKEFVKIELAKSNIKLVDEVKIDFEDVVEMREVIGLVDLAQIASVSIHEKKALKKPPVKVKKPRIKEERDVFVAVEEMPRFGDCEESGRGKLDDCSTQKLLAFLAEEIEYPTIARESNIVGRVIAEFVVEKDGKVRQVKILRDIGGGCGQETVRVLKKMPKWTPGHQQGKPVRVRYVVPVKYQLD